MERTFNVGIGMIAVVAAGDAAATLAVLERSGHRAFEIGRTVAGEGVTISPREGGPASPGETSSPPERSGGG